MPIKPVSGKIDSQEINDNLSYLESIFQNLNINSPKGAYSTLTALQSAFPNGDNGVYIVSADGKWYYWNGSAWTAGGTYQSTTLASGIVTADKLNTQFDYRAYLNSNENLNNIVDAGTYYVNAATNKPGGITGTLHILEVTKVYSRWVVQRIYDFAAPHIVYSRRIDQSTASVTEWVKTINKDDVIASKENYSANINSLITQGTYLILASATGTFPTGWNTGVETGTMLVTKDNGRFVTQRLMRLNDPTRRYVRTIDAQTSTPSEWVKEPNLSNLAGKKVVCLGDSITEFGNYPQIVSIRTGATVYNCGFGGTRLANHGEPNYDAFSTAKVVESIVSGNWSLQDSANTTTGYTTTYTTLKGLDFNNIDYVVIFAGTNDWAGTDTYGSVQLGEDTDTTRTTFKGAVYHIVKTLLEAFPHLKISFVTPIWRSRIVSGDGQDSDNFPNRDGVMLLDFVDAMKTMGNKNHIPVFDFYRNSGINKFNEARYLVDGVHPTDPVGYQHVGNKISVFLTSNF